MKYLFKVLVRLPFSFFFVIRNIFFEYWFSRKLDNDIQGLADLRKHGFHVFENLLNAEDVSELRADFKRIEESNPVPVTGQLAGRAFKQGPISELSLKFISCYRPFAESYFESKHIRCELTMYQRSWPNKMESEVPGGEYHVDDNKRNLKFFVYLTDVDLDSGPFCYVPNTHRYRGFITFWRWWLWEIFRARRFLYGFGLDISRLDVDAEQITGRAGLCFCADTTGYHKAIPVNYGERQVFVVSFTRNQIQF